MVTATLAPSRHGKGFAASHGNTMKDIDMKRGYFASLAFAVLACISFTGNAFMRIAEVVVVTSRALKNWVFDGFTLAAAHSADKQRPQIKRMIAKAFVLRLIKRERPVVTACWRSCPST